MSYRPRPLDGALIQVLKKPLGLLRVFLASNILISVGITFGWMLRADTAYKLVPVVMFALLGLYLFLRASDLPYLFYFEGNGRRYFPLLCLSGRTVSGPLAQFNMLSLDDEELRVMRDNRSGRMLFRG